MRSLILFSAIVLAARASAATEHYDIDPVHTNAIFKINHVGVSNFYGRFRDIAGTMTVDAADPAKNAISVSIKTASVDTRTPKLDSHLVGPDFFNAVEKPEMTFVSTKFTPAGTDAFDVAGTFTLLGTSKPLTVRVQKVGENELPQMGHRIGYETTFTIKRSDYGMNFMPGMLGDDVQVILSVEAIRK